MSAYPPTPPQQQQPWPQQQAWPQQGYAPPPTNGTAVTGFVISIVALVVSLGILSPIGLIVSLVGLGKAPRGFAIAGTIIGLIGSMVGVFALLVITGVIGRGWGLFNNPMHTQFMLDSASFDIDYEYAINNNTLPSTIDGNNLISQYTDQWGTTIRYEPTPGTADEFDLISAGPDLKFGTGDDVSQHYFAGMSPGQPQWGPQTNNEPDARMIDAAFERAAQRINNAYPAGSSLPDAAAGTSRISGNRDAWENPFQYAPTDNPPWYQLHSAGPDGVWYSADDIYRSYYFEPQVGPSGL